MKLIGYAAHNLTLGASASKTVRLRNVTDKRLRELIEENLADLTKIIKWNIKHEILFYRITSNLIPYASHEANTINWESESKQRFQKIGELIKQSNMLVSMHPGQYTVLSSPNKDVVRRSIKEIEYHNKVLTLLRVENEAKITIHLGGTYKNKANAMKRWANNFNKLSNETKKRLVIENDDKSYKISDCLKVYENCGTPIVFDKFHYDLNPDSGLTCKDALKKCLLTWQRQPIKPIVHFSNQAMAKPKGTHSQTIELKSFKKFYNETKDLDFNIMLETKDKEKSALKILKYLKQT